MGTGPGPEPRCGVDATRPRARRSAWRRMHPALTSKPQSHGLPSHVAAAASTLEGLVELLRARRERRHALIINDPQPVASADDVWASAAQLAIIGIFILLAGRGVLCRTPDPVADRCRLVIGMTFAPIVRVAGSASRVALDCGGPARDAAGGGGGDRDHAPVRAGRSNGSTARPRSPPASNRNSMCSIGRWPRCAICRTR